MDSHKDVDHLDPQERLKLLINYSNLVKVDPHVSPIKYYRSGVEMIRMANVYFEEGSLEHAYVLYLKYMTLFLEKIRKHPDFNQVPNSFKVTNQSTLRGILPKAEKLKQQLLLQYTDDYNRYIAEIKQFETEELQRKRNSVKKPVAVPVPATPPANIVIARTPKPIDDIKYPDPNLPSAPPLSPETELQPPHPPLIDRTKKPSDVVSDRFNSGNLRTVIVPDRVVTIFQKLAHSNTVNNVETCGILAGKLERNELIITNLILPKQKGTSDSCATLNEEEIFDYQDQLNLITIGWIHTHPTQTAFLSSVDLHTQCPYQLLMPEAVAIVCAPKYNETGYFVLTPTYGVQYISNCRETGFHPHPADPPLFKVADHIRIKNNADLDVLDLRI